MMMHSVGVVADREILIWRRVGLGQAGPLQSAVLVHQGVHLSGRTHISARL
jgi:hypothetical protein